MVFVRYLILILIFSTNPLHSKEIHFEKRKISIGKKTLLVEIADTPERTSRGLMHRREMRENQGMLFVFPKEQPLSFWMKNTLIPLSIGFFDREKKLLEILHMKPIVGPERLKTYKSQKPAKYALEVNLGWFKRNGIKPNMVFKYK